MNDSEFDPNQPFEVVEPEFDPNQPFEVSSNSKQIEEPSTFSDFLTSTGQALTFNTSDEIKAGLKAAYESATTDQKLSDLYDKYRQIEQQKIKEAEERSPYATMAGSLAGGAATTLIGGMGLKAGLAALKAAGTGAKSAQALSLLDKISKSPTLSTATAGAIEGTLLGAGGATDEESRIAEGLKTGAIGGALGAAGSLAFEGTKGLAKLASSTWGENIPLLRQTKTAFKEGLEGTSFTGSKSTDEMLERQDLVVSDLADAIFDAKKVLFDQKDEILKKAGEKGEIIDFKPIISKLKSVIPAFENEPNFNRLQALLSKTEPSSQNYFQLGKKQSGFLSPLEANEVKNLLNDYVSSSYTSLDSNVLNVVKNAKKYLSENLKKIEGVADIDENVYKLLLNTAETLAAKGIPIKDIIKEGKFISKLGSGQKQREVVREELLNLVRKASKPGSRTDESFRTLNALKQNLQQLEKDKPGFLKSIGFDEKKFLDTLQKESDISTVSQVIRGEEGTTNPLKALIGVTPRGATYGAANWIGYTVPNKLFAAADDKLLSWASSLESKGNKKLADTLTTIAKDKTGISRKALLFSLLQKPETRKELTSLLESESTEEGLK